MLNYWPIAAGIPVAIALLAMGAAPPGPPQPAAAGKRIFIRCAGCHSLSAQARPMTGPHLQAIVGRKVASVEGYTYSQALRTRNFRWDEARLDRWLSAPQAEIAGLCLPFTGLAKPADRAALIAYLKQPAS